MLSLCLVAFGAVSCEESKGDPIAIAVDNTHPYTMGSNAQIDLVFNVFPTTTDASDVAADFGTFIGSSDDPQFEVLLPRIMAVKKNNQIAGQWSVTIGLFNSTGKQLVPDPQYTYSFSSTFILILGNSKSAPVQLTFSK